MKALFLNSDGPTLRQDLPIPNPLPGQARIRLRKAGVCSTDLELIKGYLGFEGILGHEFVGTVDAVHENTTDGSRWIGQRVVGTINLGCRTCAVCVGSGPEHCPNRTVLGIAGHHGAFADYLTLPLANLLVVPESVSDEAAVFTEPLAAALRIREQVRVAPSAKVAIVGPGRLGLLITQVLALAGANPLVLGRRMDSLVLPASWGLETALVGDAPSDAFDLVVEATGNPEGLRHSLRLVRPCGTLVMKSTFEGETTVDLTKIVVGEIRVLGSRCGPFAPALRSLEREEVDVLSMIAGEYALADGLNALDHAARPGVHKILLRAE